MAQSIEKFAILRAGEFDHKHYLDQCIAAGLTDFLSFDSLLDHYLQRGRELGLRPRNGVHVAERLRLNPPASESAEDSLGRLVLHEREDSDFVGLGGDRVATNSHVGSFHLEAAAETPLPSNSKSTVACEGNVDYLSANRAIGWAWLPGHVEAVAVRVTLEGRVLASGVTCQVRSDLEAAGKGSGRCGFDLSFESVDGDAELVVEVISGADCTSLPVTYRETPKQSVAAVGPVVQNASFRIGGGVDRLTQFEASGWVWAPAFPEATLHVEAVVANRVIGRACADVFRQDLFDHCVGTGLYGFRIEFSETLPMQAKLAFRVLMATSYALTCSVDVTPVTAGVVKDRSNSTVENLVAAHDRFTSPGPEFEEHDPAILEGLPDGDCKPLILAFYLPQFHAIDENDAFWGKGFTEWRQLPRGMSRFPGHYQPRIPRDLGFYNLTNVDHLQAQVALAAASGIGAFAFYYYWFNGQRVLERPLDLLVSSGVDMKFLLIWANENWTRTWDGSESDVLLRQDYRPEDEGALLADFAQYFSDARYVRIEGRPLFFIYNPGSIPDTRRTILRWRAKLSVQHSVDPLFFMCQTFGQDDPRDLGFDGAMEFPPHKLTGLVESRATSDAYSPDYAGRIFSYDEIAAASLALPCPDFPLIKTTVPGWDNDPRKPNRGFTLENIAPRKYEAWLAELLEGAMERPVFGQPIVAVNAWNEWAECAYLEPDVHYGAAFLNATARAMRLACESVRTANWGPSGGGGKVSVIVPNFNHARYLPERLGSILGQTVPPDEIIFLDDCSSDESLAVASEILAAGGVAWKIIPNETNSGCVFRQWIKGLALARNDLVWIAESDDAAHPRFLERLLPAFDRPDVLAAFGRIQCVDVDGAPRADLDNYFNGLEHFAWRKSCVVPAYAAFQGDFTVKNVIPNASGLVFRKPRLSEAEIARLYEYHFAGDWYFYALVLRGGAVAYQNRARSYFRIGAGSASRSVFFSEQHWREHAMILEDLTALYGPERDALLRHIQLLSRHFPQEAPEALAAGMLPDLRRSPDRPLRICVAAHSFDVGGGELLPLEIANALKARGHHVTYLVLEPPVPGVERTLWPRLRSDIPVTYWQDIKGNIGEFLRRYGIDAFNSHNISIEFNFTNAQQTVGVPYIASLHGGYENAPDCVTPELLAFVGRTVDQWLYLGEKNIDMLLDAGLPLNRFIRGFNAVAPPAEAPPARSQVRATYRLDDSTIVLFVCSRAIHAKGWQTAIDATRQLVDAGRKVHLMLIGDGPDLPRLRGDNQHLPFVTFLGHVDQPARLFGGFDIGVFPSTFAGETFPLFLLECFGPGLPVVSTDIGEIGYIMGERKEAWPGVLVSHRQDAAAVAKGMAEAIGGIIDDPALLRRMRENALQTSDRFSMDALVALYEQAFRRLVVQTNRGAPNEQDQGEGRVLGAAA